MRILCYLVQRHLSCSSQVLNCLSPNFIDIETLICQCGSYNTRNIRSWFAFDGYCDGFIHRHLVPQIIPVSKGCFVISSGYEKFLTDTMIAAQVLLRKIETYPLGFCQLLSYPIHVHDALCRISVTQDLRVELAQSFSFPFG